MGLLAHQTVMALEERGAKLTEAEYLYLVRETVDVWMKHSTDAVGKALVQNNPAEVVQRALVYQYRDAIQKSYDQNAELCLPKLLDAKGDPVKRELAITQHLAFGDPDVARRMILMMEAKYLEQLRTARSPYTDRIRLRDSIRPVGCAFRS